ncbi:hypothetical protein [Cupriavidus taiwanensis]|uniref:hypothetical protein n=1 Tax=Cupriavidus taiwanensis TaxID=164546 RepID=UPI000E10A763|nr:hypothetical protein [Cupriavidus taiwanensis]SOY48500.1 hypothetical protein CBM2592_A190006 [Cupriavidus taiwanensis]SOY83029.1 hypothetical protein CBM2591_A230007 [Cupriavidus taiwanensis]SOZ56199.1 hypothetical protein CBM2617_A200013 [Cupriavidus taiwanensis]SOZ78798.1 hypothetical protein CBM2618_A180013 [Cupriavidus taiwanensis]SOZ79066.1 hypothetical protein CBM2622_A170012 [Cupriavidus taiwanensis]
MNALTHQTPRPTVTRICGGISDTLIDELEDLGDPFMETPHSYQIKAPPRSRRLPGGISDTLLN